MVAWRHGLIPPVDRLLELTYRAEQSHFWFRGFRQYVKPMLARATAGVAAPRILDCGCGTGSNLEMLRHYAQDAGKPAAEIAKITEPKRELSFEAAGVLVLD